MSALAAKLDKRALEVVKPSLYNTFPSSGISVFNSGYSGLKSGLVAGGSYSLDHTIAPAISYDSAGHLFSSGLFGGAYPGGIVTGAPVVDGLTAVTAAPAFGDASIVTGAPAVVTAAPPVVTAAPSVVTAAPPVVTAVPPVVGAGPVVSEGYPFGSAGVWNGAPLALGPAVVGSGKFLFG